MISLNGFYFSMNIFFKFLNKVHLISSTSMATSTVEINKAQFIVLAVHASANIHLSGHLIYCGACLTGFLFHIHMTYIAIGNI